MEFYGRKGVGVMEQLELPFKGGYPPHWACCVDCKHKCIVDCSNIVKCLYRKGKYTKMGGVFFKYYNLFEDKGD